MKHAALFLLTLLSIFIMGCNNDNNNTDDAGTNLPPIPSITYSISASQPHDTSFFTQGLEFYENSLIESTGNYGDSKLIQYDASTGRLIREVKLDDKYFGEGVTILNDTIYQLTWKENVVLVYSISDLKKIKELPLRGEGWGITNDGKNLIVSNGSSDLFIYEPSAFKLLNTLTVKENGSFVPNINELEFVNGYVYANQWQSNYIFKIELATGNVVGKMDLSQIVRNEKAINPKAQELNGIAYNPTTKKFYITGKDWSRIYEMQWEH